MRSNTEIKRILQCEVQPTAFGLKSIASTEWPFSSVKNAGDFWLDRLCISWIWGHTAWSLCFMARIL